MKIERKFHKGAQFDKPCKIHFLLRVDDLKKVVNWSQEDFDYALKMLEIVKLDIEKHITLMKGSYDIVNNLKTK